MSTAAGATGNPDAAPGPSGNGADTNTADAAPDAGKPADDGRGAIMEGLRQQLLRAAEGGPVEQVPDDSDAAPAAGVPAAPESPSSDGGADAAQAAADAAEQGWRDRARGLDLADNAATATFAVEYTIRCGRFVDSPTLEQRLETTLALSRHTGIPKFSRAVQFAHHMLSCALDRGWITVEAGRYCVAREQLDIRRAAGLNVPPPAAGIEQEKAALASAAEAHGDWSATWLHHGEISRRFAVDAGALRKRLDRWRVGHDDDWREVPDRRPREPKYLYRLAAVAPLVDELRASGESSSERPAKES